MNKNENNNKYISCGKIDKKYWLYILLIIILIAASLGLFFLFRAYLKNNKPKTKVAVNRMSFLFFEKLGESLMIIPRLISKKMNSSNKNNEITKQNNNNIKKYIF